MEGGGAVGVGRWLCVEGGGLGGEEGMAVD